MKGTNGCADKWRSRLINPVLGKEFTLRMRTVRSMWALFFYLLAIGLLALGYLYVTRMSSSGANAFNPDESRIMFIFISFVQLGLIAFMAPGLTAGVISGEREKQTLNLLLTTQQSSASIVISLFTVTFCILRVSAARFRSGNPAYAAQMLPMRILRGFRLSVSSSIALTSRSLDLLPECAACSWRSISRAVSSSWTPVETRRRGLSFPR